MSRFIYWTTICVACATMNLAHNGSASTMPSPIVPLEGPTVAPPSGYPMPNQGSTYDVSGSIFANKTPMPVNVDRNADYVDNHRIRVTETVTPVDNNRAWVEFSFFTTDGSPLLPMTNPTSTAGNGWNDDWRIDITNLQTNRVAKVDPGFGNAYWYWTKNGVPEVLTDPGSGYIGRKPLTNTVGRRPSPQVYFFDTLSQGKHKTDFDFLSFSPQRNFGSALGVSSDVNSFHVGVLLQVPEPASVGSALAGCLMLLSAFRRRNM